MWRVIKVLFLMSVLIIVGLVSLWSYLFYQKVERELPRLDAMDDYRPALTSRVYSSDGLVIGEFAIEDRELVTIAEIPKRLQEAILAVEDTDFYQHNGVNFKAIIRAMKINLAAGKVVQGGSTLTQQVARELFLTKEKALMRKIKEALLAVKIESRFTKSQILEMYCNQLYFGHGAYGVKSSARRYFGKSLHELTLAECALLAGMPQAPSSISPFTNMEKALRRRELVLNRMVEAGFISSKEAEEAINEPVVLKTTSSVEFSCPYFLEYLRKTLEDQLSTPTVHKGGLRIYTTLDSRLQNAAQQACFWGLFEYSKRKGYKTGLEPTEEENPELRLPGTVLQLPVVAVTTDTFSVEIDGKTVVSNPQKDGWSVPTDLRKKLKPGDQVQVVIAKNTRPNEPPKIQLYQDKGVQAALLCMETGTGYVCAWVGGTDFDASKFDRVYQSRRQPGSGFKPIIYAAAFDTQYTPADIIFDSPIVTEMSAPVGDEALMDTVDDATSGNDGDESNEEDKRYWKPGNYSARFGGPTTLRNGLELSKNVVTIKLLSSIGVRTAIRYAQLFGIQSPLASDLSLGLGTSGVTLMELTSAYSVFANAGNWVKPVAIKKVTDREGQVIWENQPYVRRALSESAAYVITNVMKGVIEHGTGARARELQRPLAGKTGTTNKSIDAWFTGFSRQFITGVWTGFDDPTTLGEKETGSRMALPIWIDFMRDAHKGLPILDFVPPPGVVTVSIDSETGLLATPLCSKVITETFIEGTEPVRLCDKHELDKSQFLRFDSEFSAVPAQKPQKAPDSTDHSPD